MVNRTDGKLDIAVAHSHTLLRVANLLERVGRGHKVEQIVIRHEY